MIPKYFDNDKSGGRRVLHRMARRLLALWPWHIAILGYEENDTRSFSVLVANTLERSALMVWESLPVLNDEEWIVICYCNSHGVGPTAAVYHIEASLLEEGYPFSEQMNVDLVALVNRMYAFSLCERIAVATFVDKFWNWMELNQYAKGYKEVVALTKQSIENSAALGNSRHSNAGSPIARY